MNSATLALVEQLDDSKSANRRSAAKKLRNSGDPDAAAAQLTALRREVEDLRTWETQYQMIMALGHCLHVEATEFLMALSREGKEWAGGKPATLQCLANALDSKEPSLLNVRFE